MSNDRLERNLMTTEQKAELSELIEAATAAQSAVDSYKRTLIYQQRQQRRTEAMQAARPVISAGAAK